MGSRIYILESPTRLVRAVYDIDVTQMQMLNGADGEV